MKTATPHLQAQDRKDALPWNSVAAFQGVLERLETLRLTHFLTLQAELLSLHASACTESNFLAHASDVACLSGDARKQILNHPVFRAWTWLTLREMNLHFIGKAQDNTLLKDLLLEFPRALERILADLSRGARPTYYRLDLDRLLARVLPPSYDMPTGDAAIASARQAAHPLGFFKDVAGVALQRIDACWPFARTMLDQLVASIAYLPDGNFRSCSAARYNGLILLSARDGSILDLEESIVHEAGHQLLYAMVEIAPVCADGAGGNYKLPWSTQVRDLYGYFHAFFIYVILARYLERVMELRTGDEVRRARDRLGHILRGLIAAVPDLQADTQLTPEGRALFEQLSTDIAALADRHPDLTA